MSAGKNPDRKIDEDFLQRRESVRSQINAMDQSVLHDQPERQDFFNAVYTNADGDAAFVPWADLKAKDKLEQWLEANSGLILSARLKAVDVACGLGDNAEALSSAGYNTTAFDLAADAIGWAKKRFPDSNVDYQSADLFDLPKDWIGAFDLVHECYTLQALPPQMLDRTASAIAGLVKPGGTLLVFTRTRGNGSAVDGPPWPLEDKDVDCFAVLGFEKIAGDRFTNTKNDRIIPHAFVEWRKTEGVE